MLVYKNAIKFKYLKYSTPSLFAEKITYPEKFLQLHSPEIILILRLCVQCTWYFIPRSHINYSSMLIRFFISFQRYALNIFFCEIIYTGQMKHDNNSDKSSVYTRVQ